MKTVLIRLSDVKHVTMQELELNARDWYIKGTDWSLIISDHTAQVAWTMFLLKSFLVTKIV